MRALLAGSRGAAAAALLLLPSLAVRAEPPRFLDDVDMAAPASRQAHRVRIAGGAPYAARFMVGALLLPVSGVRLEPGGRVLARLETAAGPGRSVSLLVTLATTPRDYGVRQVYSVRVDGREVYHAAERDPGAGLTRSFYLDLPGPRRSADIEILADPDTDAPVTVASIRAFAAPSPPGSPPARGDADRRRMGLALLTPKGIGYAIDAPTMREMAALLPRSPFLEGQLAVLYNFCVRDAAASAREIDRLAGLAEETGLPLRIAFQFHWAGIPGGVPDGAGGTFTDVPYQQITFDPDDQVDDPGLAALMGDRYDVRYGLSVPNRWGDTPWLTFNHPRLNQFRRVRLTYALAAWRAARERLLARGKGRLLPPQLSTGEETIYWAKGVDDSAYTQRNGGKPRARLMADFNPFVVADALRDGIDLDPRDGLNGRERWWLHQNLARWQQTIVDWMRDALPAEPVRLDRGAPVFAPDLARRNLYTEPYAMPCFPMKDASAFHPGLEVGYVRDGRSGGEYWSGATMLPWLLKERERGRIALPNLECTGANDPQLVACLQAAYACGARFATLYNWQHRQNITDLLAAFAGSIEKPAGVEFPPDALQPAPPAGGRSTRVYTAPPGAFGVNCIRLYIAGAGKGTRARVVLREADPMDEPAEMVVTASLPAGENGGPWTVYLPAMFPQEPGRRYALTVEALDRGGPGFRAAPDGAPAADLCADIAFERARSLAIEDRQDAADLLDSLRARHARTAQSMFAREALAQAERQFETGQSQEAYRAAVRAEQLSLPAAFELAAPGGRLAPYWITLRCPGGPVRAVIRAYTDRAAVVSIRSRVAQVVTVRWGGFETTAALTANVPAEITLEQRGRGPRGARRSALR